jgi:hypothetical protein
MSQICIDNNISQLILTAKNITNRNCIDYSEIKFSIDKKNELFSPDTLTQEQIEYNKDIDSIEINFYSNEDIYLKNLNFLPNMTKLSFMDLKSCYLPKDLNQLINLKELDIHSGIENWFEPTKRKYCINNLNILEHLVNLEHLVISVELGKFPPSILKLSKLKYICIESTNIIIIPPELCDLEELSIIKINKIHSNTLIHKNKMIIFDWEAVHSTLMELDYGYMRTKKIVDIEIPEEITELKILNCHYNSLDNLPSNIQILRLGTNILYPLTNLPFGLKKLIIYLEKRHINKENLITKIKLPFGCELVFDE